MPCINVSRERVRRLGRQPDRRCLRRDNGGSKWEDKLELKPGKRGKHKKEERSEGHNRQSRAVWVYFYWERRKAVNTSTVKHTHTDTYYCLMLRSDLYVGSRCLSAAGVIYPCCMARHYAMEHHWWPGFKEPYLLFQHEKVHLEASVISHLFPQLRLGCIMMANSHSLSPAASLSSSSPDPSLSLSLLFHMLKLCHTNNKRWL